MSPIIQEIRYGFKIEFYRILLTWNLLHKRKQLNIMTLMSSTIWKINKRKEVKEYLHNWYDEEKRNNSFINPLRNSARSKSESNPNSDKSIMNEFWEDFDFQNKLKSDKAKFKFIDFDDPFRADAKELEQLEEDLYKNFNPNKSPILENYHKLTQEFKMSSRILIELEKKYYRNYIQTIKKAAKTIINRVKSEAKIKAKKIVSEQVESAKK